MPNHFHLLINFDHHFDFPNVMRAFSTSYVKSFNRLYNRTGHLFEGDYHARVVENENYLCAVIRYIHLNPCFAGLVAEPEDWLYSDYQKWSEDSSDASLPSIQVRDTLCGNGLAYEEFVEDYASAKADRKKIEVSLSDFR